MVDADGCPPLHNAAFLGRRKCLQYLISKGAQVGVKDFDGGTAVHKAAFSGHRHCLKDLVKAGCDPTAVDAESASPLQKAVFNSHVTCVRYLVDVAKPTVNLPNISGTCPIHVVRLFSFAFHFTFFC
jgi:ankyrin repeat protein